MTEYYVGIDLGTTNSIICVYRRGNVETISVDGRKQTPSVVSIRGNETFVGEEAKRLIMVDPDHTIASVKRNMGNLKYKYKIDEKEFTPSQISSMILKKLLKAAERELGVSIKKAVISVPAYFNDDQRADTKKAAEMAGVEVLRLISEPTAAAIAYGVNQNKDQRILVYDLGGGTFDVSILEVKENNFIVNAVGGDHHLGGDDFDRDLSGYLKKVFKDQTNINLDKEKTNRELLGALQKLKEECEKVKIELSDAPKADLEIPMLYRGKSLKKVTITREILEKLIKDKLTKTERIVRETIKAAGMTSDEIDRVILVGGSSEIPSVKEIVTKTVKEPYKALNIMEIVAQGAALVAAHYLAIKEKGDKPIEEELPIISGIRDICIKEIYPYSLGIEVVDCVPEEKAYRYSGIHERIPEDGKILVNGVFSELIKKNSRIPIERVKVGYSSVMDYQKEVRIKIFRGEGKEGDPCKEMEPLGDFLIEIESAPAGYPQIAVAFDISENGILKVAAVDMLKNKPVSIERDISHI